MLLPTGLAQPLQQLASRLVLGGGTKTEDREDKSAAARSTRGNTTRPARAIAIKGPESFTATGQERLSQNCEPVQGSRDHDGHCKPISNNLLVLMNLEDALCFQRQMDPNGSKWAVTTDFCTVFVQTHGTVLAFS